MISFTLLNPARYHRWAKPAAATVAAFAILATAACGSPAPTSAPLPAPNDNAAAAPAATSSQPVETAEPAGGLATPEVVLPTRTPIPTNTPLPVATQIALGTLAPVTQEPTPTPLPEDLVADLSAFQFRQGEPITWINHRDWVEYNYDHGDRVIDVTAPEFWTIGHIPATRGQASFSTRNFTLDRHFPGNPSTGRLASPASYVRSAFGIVHRYFYAADKTTPTSNAYAEFTYAFIKD